MTQYTYAELEGLWINAGGPRRLAPIAAAIAEAESGGRSDATNPNDNGGRQTSWGLWQISNGTHAQPVPNILNPAVNARQAVAKWRAAGGFSPWGTYDSGAYKAFMSGKTTPNLNVPGSGSTAGGANTGITTTAAVAAYNPDTCLWSFPGVQMPIVGNVGQFCLISKPQARAWIGAGVMLGGILLVLPGLSLIVAAAGARALGAAGPVLRKTGAVVALVPGAEPAGVAIAGAGQAGMATARQTATRRQRATVQTAREAPARGRHSRPSERAGRHARPAEA